MLFVISKISDFMLTFNYSEGSFFLILSKIHLFKKNTFVMWNFNLVSAKNKTKQSGLKWWPLRQTLEYILLLPSAYFKM